MTDTATIAMITTVVVTPITALLTLMLTKGVDAWVRVRQTKSSERMEKTTYEDTQARQVYDLLIKTFEARVAFLEADRKVVISKLELSEKGHMECLVNYEALRGDFKALQKDVERLTDHDKRNTAHVEHLKKAEEELAKKGLISGDLGPTNV